MPKAAAAFPVLTTRRLRLRQVEPRDAVALHACFSDPTAMRYWNFPSSYSLAETEKIMGWLGKASSPYSTLAWTVARKTDDACIGMVNYHNREARHARLDIGYIIAPGEQRRGLGAEAVAALVAYCEGTLKVHRITALIHPDNVASIALAEAAGFALEGGPLKDFWRVGEEWRSVMVYARLGGG